MEDRTSTASASAAVLAATRERPAGPRFPGNGPISRRSALGGLAALAAGSVLGGCTPLRMLAGWYPAEFDRDPELTDRVLRAFVDTVIPGVPLDDPDLARVFVDPRFPFADHATFFAADLCRRAGAHSPSRFHELSRPRRVAVVQEGLRTDRTTQRLYEGGIFLAQVAVFAGIYDDSAGCALIEFEGRYRIRPLRELTFAEPGRFLPSPTTASGHAA